MMNKLRREPLVWFLLAGAAIFAIDAYVEGDTELAVIDVTSTQLQRISDQWQAQMGRPPTEEELSGLVEAWVREEIYYREALAMGLDNNDTIIRRRLTQKLTFLTEDLADAAAPDDNALRAYYDQTQDQYLEPEKFSFEHRFFSRERRTDAYAEALSAASNDEPVGDPFMLQSSYAARSQRQLRDLFGGGFAASLADLEVSERWAGPIESAYGWHLVRLAGRTPQQLLSFEQVRNRVANDLQMQRRSLANDELYFELRNRYEIRLPGPGQ